MKTLRYAKSAVIDAIIEAYDELANARHELELAQAVIYGYEHGEDSMRRLDRKMLEVGRERVFRESVNGYCFVLARRDEDGEIVADDFDRFLSGYRPRIPSWMSADDFVLYFESELRDAYEQARKKAIDELRRKEGDDE